jgi:hypothetical protein
MMIGRSKQKITNLVVRRVSQHGVALGGFGAVFLLFFWLFVVHVRVSLMSSSLPPCYFLLLCDDGIVQSLSQLSSRSTL